MRGFWLGHMAIIGHGNASEICLQALRDLIQRCPEFRGWAGYQHTDLLAPYWDAIEGTYAQPTEPPTTIEACELLSRAPSGIGPGIPWSLDDAGVHRHTTATGRTTWEVHPDGTVEIRIDRPVPGTPWPHPGYTVLSARVEPDGTWSAEHVGGVYRQDHVDSLADALRPLVPEADLSVLRERAQAIAAAAEAIAVDEAWRDRAAYELGAEC